MSRFDAGGFAVDDQMVDFPIFDDYDVRGELWAEIEGGRPATWQDSLRIFEAVVYNVPLGISKSDFV